MDWKELLGQLVNKQQVDQVKLLQCGQCKTTLQYIFEVGKMGCPQCYDTFSSVLKKLVEQMQFKHVGKYPKNGEVKELEQQMIIAALEGRFEEAEGIQEKIKRLRGKCERNK